MTQFSHALGALFGAAMITIAASSPARADCQAHVEGALHGIVLGADFQCITFALDSGCAALVDQTQDATAEVAVGDAVQQLGVAHYVHAGCGEVDTTHTFRSVQFFNVSTVGNIGTGVLRVHANGVDVVLPLSVYRPIEASQLRTTYDASLDMPAGVSGASEMAVVDPDLRYLTTTREQPDSVDDLAAARVPSAVAAGVVNHVELSLPSDSRLVTWAAIGPSLDSRHRAQRMYWCAASLDDPLFHIVDDQGSVLGVDDRTPDAVPPEWRRGEAAALLTAPSLRFAVADDFPPATDQFQVPPVARVWLVLVPHDSDTFLTETDAAGQIVDRTTPLAAADRRAAEWHVCRDGSSIRILRANLPLATGARPESYRVRILCDGVKRHDSRLLRA